MSYFEFKEPCDEAGASSPAIHSERFNTRAPTSNAVQVNVGNFPFESFTGNFLTTELEARLHPAMEVRFFGRRVKSQRPFSSQFLTGESFSVSSCFTKMFC
jgi:hypothetical protein